MSSEKKRDETKETWRAMERRSFPDARQDTTPKDRIAIAFPFFFDAQEGLQDWYSSWKKEWKLDTQVYDADSSIASKIAEVSDRNETIQLRLGWFLRTQNEHPQEPEEDKAKQLRVVSKELGGQSWPPLDLITAHPSKELVLAVLSEWIALKRALWKVLTIAQQELALLGPYWVSESTAYSTEYTPLIESWEHTNAFQDTAAQAIDVLFSLFKSKHFRSHSDLLIPSSDSTRREMEVRYHLDRLHAPIHPANREVAHTAGLPQERYPQLRKFGIKQAELDTLQSLSLDAQVQRSCPSFVYSNGPLLDDVTAVNFMAGVGRSHTQHSGNYDVWAYGQRKTQFLFPANLLAYDLEGEEKMQEESKEPSLEIDHRVPFSRKYLSTLEDKTVVDPLLPYIDFLDSVVHRAFGSDAKDLLPLNDEHLIASRVGRADSGTQAFAQYTLHRRTQVVVCGPLLSETPKAFFNIYHVPEELKAVQGSGSVLVVAWDAMYYARLSGWNETDAAYEPFPAYKDGNSPKGLDVIPGASVRQCSTECEYWNRLDWATYVDPHRTQARSRLLKIGQILESVLSVRHSADPNDKRMNPDLYVRVLDPGQACILPKPGMGYMLFTLGGVSTVLEKNFLVASTLPSAFLRYTLPILPDIQYPTFQPRSLSESAFSRAVADAPPETRKLLANLIARGGTQVESEADLSADDSLLVEGHARFYYFSWGVGRDKNNWLVFNQAYSESSLRSKSELHSVEEWGILPASVKARQRLRSSPGLHDPEWRQTWDSDALKNPDCLRAMVMGNYLPAYLVDALLVTDPLTRELTTKRSQGLVGLGVVGGVDTWEEGKTTRASTSDAAHNEFVNYQGLWVLGNRVVVTDPTFGGESLLEFVQVAASIYPLGLSATEDDTEEEEAGEKFADIAGLSQAGTRWLCVGGDAVVKALYEEVEALGMLDRISDSKPELLAKRGRLKDIWLALLGPKTVDAESALIKSFPFESHEWMMALITGKNFDNRLKPWLLRKQELDYEAVKSALRVSCTAQISGRESAEAKEMLNQLNGDDDWALKVQFTDKTRAVGRAILIYAGLLEQLQIAAKDELKTLSDTQVIPLLPMLWAHKTLQWIAAVPDLPRTAIDNLTVFGAAQQKSKVSTGTEKTEAALSRQAKLAEALHEEEAEDIQLERDTAIELLHETQVENRGIDAFLYGFGTRQAFLKRLVNDFGSDVARKTELDKWKESSVGGFVFSAKSTTPALRHLALVTLEKMAESALGEEEKKGEENPLSNLMDVVDSVFDALSDLAPEEKLAESATAKSEARPYILRANTLVDTVVFKLLSKLVEYSNTFAALNAAVSDVPVRKADKKAKEQQDRDVAEAILESMDMKIEDLNDPEDLREAAEGVWREEIARYVKEEADEELLVGVMKLLGRRPPNFRQWYKVKPHEE